MNTASAKTVVTTSLAQPADDAAHVAATGAIARVHRVIRWLESVSVETVVSTPARIFVAVTFWLSGRTKVDGLLSVSDSTFFLFQYEYSLPLLPHRFAAYVATYAEHLFPVLLILGLASRLSAASLLLMTAVIQFFVYPNAWATHLGWAAALAFILFRGPGALSLDSLIRKRF